MSKERNYSKEEKEIALAYYHKCGSNAKTRRILGYPSKSCLNNWITSEGKEAKPFSTLPLNHGTRTGKMFHVIQNILKKFSRFVFPDASNLSMVRIIRIISCSEERVKCAYVTNFCVWDGV